jgi:putative GTP pyrophosphokinase
LIAWWRSQHARPLSIVNANLRYYLREQAPSITAQRLKRHTTIVDKLIREPRMNLTQMADIGGCRAILPDQKKVDAVTRRVQKNWTIVRTRDYVREPKASGYRAVHHIVRRMDRLIEVQLRTPLQDIWANQVERDSRRLGIGLKSGLGSQLVHAYYAQMSELFALRETGSEADSDFMQRLRDRYQAAHPYLEGEGERRRQR